MTTMTTPRHPDATIGPTGPIALLIPVTGPVQTIVLDGGLEQLQELVGGGNIEAVSLPEFIPDSYHATAYLNEDGKYRDDLKVNGRATDLFVPGVGLMFGDYVAGPLLVCGFDPNTGEHADLPAGVERRVRLIEREAGR